MYGCHGNHFVIKTTQKYCKNDFICKDKEIKKNCQPSPCVSGLLSLWCSELSCVLLSSFNIPTLEILEVPSDLPTLRECVDTKIPWRSTRGRTNIEVDEGSFPLFSKVQPNLVRVPHFLSANCTSSDLKCLFENANLDKSFARDRLSFLTSTVPEVSIFQGKVTVSS